MHINRPPSGLLFEFGVHGGSWSSPFNWNLRFQLYLCAQLYARVNLRPPGALRKEEAARRAHRCYQFRCPVTSSLPEWGSARAPHWDHANSHSRFRAMSRLHVCGDVGSGKAYRGSLFCPLNAIVPGLILRSSPSPQSRSLFSIFSILLICLAEIRYDGIGTVLVEMESVCEIATLSLCAPRCLCQARSAKIH